MDSVKQDRHIVVQIIKDFKDIDIFLPNLKKLVKAICNRFGLLKATISIAIVDDAQIRRVNKQFLNHDCPTDCLSFNLSDDEPIANRESKIENRKSFELVVNGEKAVAEATLRGHLAEAELALYITHSLLHNLGFDDSTRDKAKKMHHTEDEILQQQGYGLVYSKDSG